MATNNMNPIANLSDQTGLVVVSPVEGERFALVGPFNYTDHVIIGRSYDEQNKTTGATMVVPFVNVKYLKLGSKQK